MAGPESNQDLQCLQIEINLIFILKLISYRVVNTVHLSYKNQSVNAVQWNNRCLFSYPHKHKTRKYTVWAERSIM
jgi:hypothetical protein